MPSVKRKGVIHQTFLIPALPWSSFEGFKGTKCTVTVCAKAEVTLNNCESK